MLYYLKALGLCILRAHNSSHVMLIKSVTDSGENVLTYNSGPRRVCISAQQEMGFSLKPLGHLDNVFTFWKDTRRLLPPLTVSSSTLPEAKGVIPVLPLLNVSKK